MTQEQRPSETLLKRIAARRPTNRQGQTLWDDEAVGLLMTSAVGLSGDFCAVKDCENCNRIHQIWWAICNNLPTEHRVKLQKKMHEVGVPLPPGHWEEVN